MRKYSKSQLKVLTDFFTNLSVAWFAGSFLSPQFFILNKNERIYYTLLGFIGTYFLLRIALLISKVIK